ncbi:MAG: polysaccharide deacetylase family protein [Oscillospiraceae bacterium]|nr:polysaccharide deacetylase family protein [Oscillospiraceae bacterium]
MKKHISLCLAAALFVVMAAVPSAVPAAAAPDVFFAAIDYTVLPLSDATMPLYAGDKLFAPTAVFAAPESGLVFWEGNGGHYIHLFSRGNGMLVFDLVSGNSFDGNYTPYPYKALRQNGRVYLPVDAVCDYFDLSYAVLAAEHGPLLRLRVTSSEVFDIMFLQASNNILRRTYYNYLATLTTPSPTPAPVPSAPASAPAPTAPSPSLQPTATPAVTTPRPPPPPSPSPAPTASPSPPPSETPSPPAPFIRERAYLTFSDGPAPGISHQILDLLDRYGAGATFFLCGEMLPGNEDAVRRMIGAGHAVGLQSYTHTPAFYQSPESMLGELGRANDLLESITMYRSRLVRAPFGSVPLMTEELCQAMTDGGYRFWDWNIDGDPAETRPTADKISAGVIADLQARRYTGAPIILLHESQNTLEALPAILSYMVENNYIFSVCTENERPFNFLGWSK